MIRHVSFRLFGLCPMVLSLGLALCGGVVGSPAWGQDVFCRPADEPAAVRSSDNRLVPAIEVRPTSDMRSPALDSRDPFRLSAPPARLDERPSEAEAIASRLNVRYRSPVVARFLASLSNQQSLMLYRETMQLIDSRHLEPAPYAVRVRQGLKNLTVAVENPAFQQANRISPTPQQVRAFQDGLRQLAEGRTVGSLADAQNVLLWAGDLGQKQLGLRPPVVVAEFIYGAVESLDKYSAFEPEDVRGRQPSAALEDHVVGIGVEIKPHADGVLVVKVLPGGPAAQAGVQAEDVIVSVDGQPLRGQGLDFAVDRIAGPQGSRLNVGFVRGGRQMTVTMVRSRVELRSVSEVKMIDPEAKVGYIKLDTFAQNSAKEMDDALWSLHRQGMQSLVIDLRGNPGGLLTTAIALSDKFLPAGKIVATHGRTPQDESAETARYAQTWKTPLVVLVDGDSASASEIFAAAIQENDRGLIVGQRTYGKGTVQTHFPLTAAAGTLRLTTAKFYSPDGREMAGSGVTPDVQLDQVGYRPGMLPNGDAGLEVAVKVARSNQLRELAQLGTSSPSRGR